MELFARIMVMMEFYLIGSVPYYTNLLDFTEEPKETLIISVPNEYLEVSKDELSRFIKRKAKDIVGRDILRDVKIDYVYHTSKSKEVIEDLKI